MTAEHKSAVEALADEWESDHGILSPDSRYTRDVLLRELREAIAADRADGALDPEGANTLRRSKSALVEKVKRLEDQIARAKMEPGQDRQKAMHAYAERAEQAEALARQEFDKATEAIERAEQAEIALAAAETRFQQAHDDALAEDGQANTCTHESATGVDTAPVDPGKVWRCDHCGLTWRQGDREGGEGR